MIESARHALQPAATHAYPPAIVGDFKIGHAGELPPHEAIRQETDRRAAGPGRRGGGAHAQARLGPCRLTMLGIGCDHRRRGSSSSPASRRPSTPGRRSLLSFVLAGFVCAFAALCYAELASMIPVSGIGLHLRLRDARRVRRLDHRLGPDRRIPVRRLDGVGRLVGLLRQDLMEGFGVTCPPSGRGAPLRVSTGTHFVAHRGDPVNVPGHRHRRPDGRRPDLRDHREPSSTTSSSCSR